MELGIGDGVLVKALANSTGRSTQQIKADMQRTGDLGVVAETSKGSQRTMFQVTTQ
jgi:DNA ligase-1